MSEPAAPSSPPLATLTVAGGHLALDFVNTVDWRDRAPQIEYLTDFPRFLDWCHYIGMIEDAEVAPLAAAAERDPARGASLLGETLALREAGYRLFRAASSGRPGEASDLGTVNRVLRRHPRRGALVQVGARYVWDAAAESLDLAGPLARLAQETVDLLQAPELARVRLCEGLGCGWLFLDTSPNRRRRWCAMAGCGNREKARRHHQRSRATG